MKKLSTLLAIIICLVACKKEVITNIPDDEGVNVVYAAGSVIDVTGMSKACYWKNGNLVLLPMPETAFGSTSTIIQKDKDIYVCGSYNSNGTFIGCVWKNSTKQDLQMITGFPRVSPQKMFIVGNDVYVSGSVDNGFSAKICYWKNGVPTVITDVHDNSAINNANAIYVSGNDIYITGQSTKYPGIEVASYWKNGTRSDLTFTHTTQWSMGKDIKFVNNTLYAGGYAYDAANLVSQAMIWKNGMGQSLPTIGDASVEDLAIIENDVYASGWFKRNRGAIKEACYWKNNAINILQTPEGSESETSSIALNNAEIFIGGTIRNLETGKSSAVYWKNGTKVNLANGSQNDARVADIFIGKE
ncbi:hypothetical protein [Pedobacter sp.]|uniref:hypothetical protein n=1 Tax=Pedobacter sp. TaxID=1411316 RepID=UPI003BACECA6